MKLKNFQYFLQVSTLLIASSLNSAYACATNYIGGDINYQYMRMKYHLNDAVDDMRAVIFSSDTEVGNYRLRYSPLNQPSLSIKSKEILVTKGFLRLLTHESIIGIMFETGGPRLKDYSAVNSFRKALYRSLTSGERLDMYPYFVGLSNEECHDLWVSKNLSHHYSHSFWWMARYWLLHEIAHDVLNHKFTLDPEISKEQEYDADKLATQAIMSSLDQRSQLLVTGRLFAAIMMFTPISSGLEFAVSNSHPVAICRGYLLIRRFISIYDELKLSNDIGFDDIGIKIEEVNSNIRLLDKWILKEILDKKSC